MKFKFLNNLNILSAFIVTGLLINNACTRSQDATSTSASSIQFSIPAQMQGSTNGLSSQTVPIITDLEHVVINISGSGFNTIAQTWSRKGSAIGGDNSVPLFSYEIPQGDARLIQAIAVYKNAEGGLDFYYGEVVTALHNETEEINITLNSVGSSTGMEGTIEGRYVSIDGTHPTGTLSTVYTPTGRSPVIIAQSPMTDGWFSSFVLSGQRLDYLIDGAVSVTGGAKQVSDFDAPVENILVTKIPQYYQNYAGTYELRPARAHIRGFFGPGTATTTAISGAQYKVCYKKAASGTDIVLSGYCLLNSNSCGTTLAYSPVGTGPTDPFNETGGYVRVVGGAPSTATPCLGATANKWTVSTGVHRFLMDPATTSPSFSKEIRGAFNTDTESTFSSSTYSLTHNVLPEVTFSSYDIYAMTKDAIDFLSYDGHAGINCNKMYPELDANNEVRINGVTKVKRLASPHTNSTISSTSFNSLTNAKLVVCPRFTSDTTVTQPYLSGAEYY